MITSNESRSARWQQLLINWIADIAEFETGSLDDVPYYRAEGMLLSAGVERECGPVISWKGQKGRKYRRFSVTVKVNNRLGGYIEWPGRYFLVVGDEPYYQPIIALCIDSLQKNKPIKAFLLEAALLGDKLADIAERDDA